MKLDVAPVGDHLHDVAGEQRAALGPVQHLRALVVAAAADERQPAAEVVRLARPRSEPPGRAAAPTSARPRAAWIGQRERVRPLDHRRVVVRVRDRDRREAALGRDALDDLVVEVRRCSPRARCRRRSSTSSARWPIANAACSRCRGCRGRRGCRRRAPSSSSSQRQPHLALVVRDVLARVLADRAGAGRLVARRVLRPAGLAEIASVTQRSRSSSATHSTCGVCGNMSTGRARTSR